jgi:hypothetical protein
MKYFNQDRYNELTANIAALEADLETWYAARRNGDDSDHTKSQCFSHMKHIREMKRERSKLPVRFEVGDGVHSGGNGDRYPYRVVEVSESGKTIKVRPMGHRAAQKYLPMGHQDWEVYEQDESVVGLITVTLRKNGRWAQEGHSSISGYGNFYPGATYTYNWEF